MKLLGSIVTAIIPLLLIVIFLSACNTTPVEISSINPVNWQKRTIALDLPDSVHINKTYLSVYSEIYSSSERRTHKLTSTISIRNTSDVDSIYILKAEYFNTTGHSIRTYFDKPIYVTPMETVEIVIDEIDTEGGTGGNFIFNWVAKPNCAEPLFEGVMISTSGQQGLSFTTQGKKIN